jgi:hypothetical protein
MLSPYRVFLKLDVAQNPLQLLAIIETLGFMLLLEPQLMVLDTHILKFLVEQFQLALCHHFPLLEHAYLLFEFLVRVHVRRRTVPTFAIGGPQHLLAQRLNLRLVVVYEEFLVTSFGQQNLLLLLQSLTLLLRICKLHVQLVVFRLQLTHLRVVTLRHQDLRWREVAVRNLVLEFAL